MRLPRLKRTALVGAFATLFFLAGCGGSNDAFVFTPNQGQIVQPDPDPNPDPVLPNPPVAVADTFVALGNGTLTQSAANGVLANDTVNGGSVAPF
ncbi:MAG: hypothetical protein KC800_08335 [Candidatus Eremiobacteraeota bacterium]|nr:hypothetical protein [Candidatus Eremiobacteraeota bacterium]